MWQSVGATTRSWLPRFRLPKLKHARTTRTTPSARLRNTHVRAGTAASYLETLASTPSRSLPRPPNHPDVLHICER